MRKKLFNSSSGISKFSSSNRLKDHLSQARKQGDLKEVSRMDTQRFIKRTKEIAAQRKLRFGSSINKTEMDKIIRQVSRETSDRINPREAAALRKAIFKK